MQRNLNDGLMVRRNAKINEISSSQVKLSIVLVLIFLLKTNFLVSEFLHNLGFPYLRLQKLIFFILPGIYIYFTSKLNHNNRHKNFFVVFIFIIIYYWLEHYVHGYSSDEGGMDHIARWIYIYIGYLILTNVGIKYLEFILKSVVTLVFINSSLIYLDYYGLVNVADISKGTGNMDGRVNSTINLNIFSDINVLAVFCIYWLSYLKVPYTFFKINIPKYYFLMFFLTITFLQSTRGSLLIMSFGFLLYAYNKWTHWTFRKKILLILGMVFLSFFQFNPLDLIAENFSIFERINMTATSVNEAEEVQDGRFLQIITSYNNFLKSPIVGVGYRNAASGAYEGIVRSNFQYTQILGSGGLILFVFYILMIFKLFGDSFKLIWRDLLVKSCISFVLIALTFRRPDAYFAILGSVVYYRYLSMKSNELY